MGAKQIPACLYVQASAGIVRPRNAFKPTFRYEILHSQTNGPREMKAYSSHVLDIVGSKDVSKQPQIQVSGGGRNRSPTVLALELTSELACEHNRRLATFIETVIADYKTEESLGALRSVGATELIISSAARAYAAKGSARGVAAVQNLAHDSGLLYEDPSPRVWFALIQAYGALERLDDVRRVFKEARRAGVWSGAPKDSRNTTTYLNALHTDVKLVFVRAKQLLDAGAAFDVAAFNVLLKACMRARDARRAKLTMNWMEKAGVEPDGITYASLIKALSYAGDFEGVLGVRDTMAAREFSLTAGCWGALLVACGAAQQVETARMIWRELKAEMGGAKYVPPTLYDAMLTACNAARQGEQALLVLGEMKSAGVVPGVKTYNLAMKACEGNPGQRARPEQLLIALSFYSEMQAVGLVADSFTYGTLLELCAEAGQGRIAAQLRDKMLEDGVNANAVVWTSLVKALARGGMVDEALAAFSKMVWGPARLKPNRVTFRTLVRELREQGALAAALKVYTGMRRAQFAPNNRDFQELIAAAAESVLADGDPELQTQVASLCNITSLTEVDLHGMSKHEARAAVLCVLGMLVSEHQRGARSPAPLTIITGRGEHSEGGQAVLPGTIRKLLVEELYIALPGVPGASENVHSNGWYGDDRGGDGVNAGRIVVGSEPLLQWLRARSASRESTKNGMN